MTRTTSSRKTAFMMLPLFFTICVAPLTLADEVEEMEAPREDIRIADFDSFGKLREEVLNLISSAKSRVWLVTEYLTDGEIVSALFLARYRKLDVKVLLGKRKAYLYMSRLGYLRQQNIPVFLKPNDFPSGYPTQILSDDKLYKLGAELNFMDRSQGTHRLQTGTKLETDHFVVAFSQAVKNGILPTPPQVPLVGRPRPVERPAPTPSTRVGMATPIPAVQSRPVYQGERDGSYNYDANRGARGATPDLPRKLPRQTILEAKKNKPAETLPREEEATFIPTTQTTPSLPIDDGAFKDTGLPLPANTQPLENH